VQGKKFMQEPLETTVDPYPKKHQKTESQRIASLQLIVMLELH
jgi:hypothetical protein